MARIRSIKPEFFTSTQVVECSPTARLLFIGMWCFCDDGGIHSFDAKRLKMEVFPGDNIDVEPYLNELLVGGLLASFTANNERWLAVTGWHHQKIEKPSYKFPRPDKTTKFDDYSTNGSPVVGDHSEQLSGETFQEPADGMGCRGDVEGKGEDVSCVELATQASTQKKKAKKPKPNPADYFFPVWPCSGPGDEISTWTLEQWQIDGWAEAFPALDIELSCRRAHAWVLANMGKRKTVGGMTKFLLGWLSRAQNESRDGRREPKQTGPRLATDEENAAWHPGYVGEQL